MYSCQNEAETRLWSLCQSLMTLVETKLLENGNAGIQINTIKCLQVLVLLLSKSTLVSFLYPCLREKKKSINTSKKTVEGRFA